MRTKPDEPGLGGSRDRAHTVSMEWRMEFPTTRPGELRAPRSEAHPTRLRHGHIIVSMAGHTETFNLCVDRQGVGVLSTEGGELMRVNSDSVLDFSSPAKPEYWETPMDLESGHPSVWTACLVMLSIEHIFEWMGATGIVPHETEKEIIISGERGQAKVLVDNSETGLLKNVLISIPSKHDTIEISATWS